MFTTKTYYVSERTRDKNISRILCSQQKHLMCLRYCYLLLHMDCFCPQRTRDNNILWILCSELSNRNQDIWLSQLVYGMYFVSCNLWITSFWQSLLKDKNNEVRKKFLDDKLVELVKEENAYRYLIFPMNSSGGKKQKDNDPYHWTVLVYDIEDGQWRHYNSIRPTERSADAYLTDARLMIKILRILVIHTQMKQK